MFDLVKYEFKGRRKFLGILLVIYLLEHIYMIFSKFSDIRLNGGEVIGASIILNIIATTLIFISILFVYNIIEYSRLLNPKPGYMLFMSNVSKTKIIFSKVLTMFIEIIGIGFISFFILIIQGNIFKIFSEELLKNLFYNLSSYEMKEIFFSLSKLTIYVASNFLVGVAIIMLSITLRQFLFKEKSFGGFITFIIALTIFIFKKHIGKFFNNNFVSNVVIHNNIRMEHSHFYSNNFNLGILVLNFLVSIGLFYLISYLLEKKIDI
jgi:hypothetical protein